MQRRTFVKAFALSASVVSFGWAFAAQAADTIKVGIMHSLSGTMAISETPLKDVAVDDHRRH
ncbi:urea ABC transporter, urea binding protein [Cedecea neteri]|uniref:Urea ABC transporter, urea binding protein n=1 Tax=Cedecea neteri TaxID=158822 RepID=A0A2X3KXM1_9ENTR|nr:urea ABC transporter, urea binding protein [Cedecea neteri]